MIDDVLQQLGAFMLWGNSGIDYTKAFFAFIALVFFLKGIQSIVLSRLEQFAKRSKNGLDDVVIGVFQNIKTPFYFFISLYFGFLFLNTSEILDTVVRALVYIVVIWEVVKALEQITDFLIDTYITRAKENKEEKRQRQAVMSAIRIVVRIVLWVIGLMLLFSNLGINITSFIASLGVGGVAVALALQSVFSDLFSSFSIYIDKPFVPGDYIVVGEHDGVVERIGLKTTRIRTLRGEELVISNQELTAARVQNFKRMEQRRIVMQLGVEYELSPQVVSSIPSLVKSVVDGVDQVRYERCYFKEFGDSALVFELSYYVLDSSFDIGVRVREEINNGIFQQFSESKIGFAYPTQTIYVKK